jgi:hypothetical protein
MYLSRFSIIVILFFVFVIGIFGYLFADSLKVKPETVWNYEGNDLMLVSSNVLDSFISEIPVTKKPKKINIFYSPDIPNNIDLLVAISKNTIMGPDGYGVACGEPVYTQDNEQLDITFYATVDKLKESVGEAEAHETINLMLRKCIRRAIWTPSVGMETAAKNSVDKLSSDLEPVLVKLK